MAAQQAHASCGEALHRRVDASGSRARRHVSLKLADQLIAAQLNIANGSDPTTIRTTVADADRLLAQFGGKPPYGVSQSSVLGQSMVSDARLLRRYNSGRQTPTCVRSIH